MEGFCQYPRIWICFSWAKRKIHNMKLRSCLFSSYWVQSRHLTQLNDTLQRPVYIYLRRKTYRCLLTKWWDLSTHHEITLGNQETADGTSDLSQQKQDMYLFYCSLLLTEGKTLHHSLWVKMQPLVGMLTSWVRKDSWSWQTWFSHRPWPMSKLLFAPHLSHSVKLSP